MECPDKTQVIRIAANASNNRGSILVSLISYDEFNFITYYKSINYRIQTEIMRYNIQRIHCRRNYASITHVLFQSGRQKQKYQ